MVVVVEGKQWKSGGGGGGGKTIECGGGGGGNGTHINMHLYTLLYTFPRLT